MLSTILDARHTSVNTALPSGTLYPGSGDRQVKRTVKCYEKNNAGSIARTIERERIAILNIMVGGRPHWE